MSILYFLKFQLGGYFIWGHHLMFANLASQLDIKIEWTNKFIEINKART